MWTHNKTRKLLVGGIAIGGGSPITVQSMTNTDTKDVEATVRQILAFEKEGCDLSRSAINSLEDARAIPEIKARTHIPFITDIQFDPDLAMYAIEYGTDGLRINPGNIGSKKDLERIVKACRDKSIPIRVGVNSGSVHKSMIDKYHGVNEESLVYSALEEVKAIENLGYDQVAVSIKSSDVGTMIRANQLFAQVSSCPLHLGVTEAGPPFAGTIKSSVGLGVLLHQGIGDTIRVSITGDPVQEVTIGMEILKSLGLRQWGPNLVSCPTCARTKVGLIGLAEKVEKGLKGMDRNITVAVMGCPVNGPGEAREADIGIACNKGAGVLFRKGKVLRQVPEEKLLDALFEEIERMDHES